MEKGPTKRQMEYLSFVQAFTERWGIPPSFEEIGRHFGTSTPSVNGMVKTLEGRGFLTRVPGAARTLRVVILVEMEPESPVIGDAEVARILAVGALVIERLVPALRGISPVQLSAALEAVAAAVDIAARAAGASDEDCRNAEETLVRVAHVAQGRTQGRGAPKEWRRG